MRWCRERGYDCRLETRSVNPSDEQRPLAWSKVPIVAKYLSYGDWVVWLDCDSFIANPALADLDSLLSAAGVPPSPSPDSQSPSPPLGASAGEILASPCPESGPLLVISEDGTMLNTGWFGVRGRCGWSLEFLRDAYGPLEPSGQPSAAQEAELRRLPPHEYVVQWAASAERDRVAGSVGAYGPALASLGTMSSPFGSFPFWEQASIFYTMTQAQGAEARAARIRLLPQWAVNSYPLPIALQLPSLSPVKTAEFIKTVKPEPDAWVHLGLHHAWIAGDAFVAFSGCNILLGSEKCNHLVRSFANTSDLALDGRHDLAADAMGALQQMTFETGAVGLVYEHQRRGR
jgi:hypothetical protein